MPRPRTVHVEEREDAVTLIPAGEPEFQDAAEQWEEFEQFRAQAETERAGKLIWVYRIPTDSQGIPVTGGQTSLLFTAPIDTYPSLPLIFNRVKKEYMARGIGRTLIRIQVRSEGKAGVHWQQVFTIEKGSNDDEPEARPGVEPSLGSLAQIISTTMAEQARQNRELIGALMSRGANLTAPDPLGQTERMIAMVTGLAGLFVNKAQGPATNSMTDMLNAVREIKRLSREFGEEMPAGDDGGNSIPQILAAGKPYVELLATLIQKSPAAPVPGVRRLPPPVRAPQLGGTVPAQSHTGGSASVNPAAPHMLAVPPNHSGAPPQGNDPMLIQLAKHVSDICDLIEQGKAEAQGIAGLILDAVPAEYDEKFYAIVADDNWLLKLKAVEPRVAKHAEFFNQVRGFIMAEFADETEAAPPAP